MAEVVHAKQKAEELVEEMGLRDPNIDIFQLASAKGAHIKFFRPEGDLATVAGFLDKDSKTIYVNCEDPPKRQVFTIAHELGHLILDHEPDKYGVLGRFERPAGGSRVEQEANAFAANLLVPEQMLAEAMRKYRLKPEDTMLLSNLFGVSEEVIRIRLKQAA